MTSSNQDNSFNITPIIYSIFILTVLVIGVGSFYAGKMSVVQSCTQQMADGSTQTSYVAKPTIPPQAPIKKCSKTAECGPSSVCSNNRCVAMDHNFIPKATCKSSADCSTGTFCFQEYCYPQYYCRSSADCEVGGACQAACAGKNCRSAQNVCAIRSKLNTAQNQIDDTRGCMQAPCRPPHSVTCVDNACVRL